MVWKAMGGKCMHARASRRRTKRWEAHIWDEKKQVYLGGFDIEEHAGMQPLSAGMCCCTASQVAA